MAGVDFREVRRRVPLLSILDLLGIQVRCPRLTWRRGPCPYACCDSPTVCGYNLAEGRWHCRRCEASGDALDLWCLSRGLTPSASVAAEFCRQAGVKIPYLARRRPPKGRSEMRTGKGGVGGLPPHT